MRLVLFHPGAARIDCQECAKYVYDLATGEPQTYRSGPDRTELPLARPAGTLPPCEKCPKESPERAKDIELSAKNWAAYGHYLECRTVGLSDGERRDPLVRRNAGIIDRAVREFERRESARHFAEAFATMLVRR